MSIPERPGVKGRLSQRWQKALRAGVVPPAEVVLDAKALKQALADLGTDGTNAKTLDADVDSALGSLVGLSVLSGDLAADYVERIRTPIPRLTPETAASLVSRAYLAHMLVEADPQRYCLSEVPVLGTLPAMKKGRVPQGLLVQVVKATRRDFRAICALPEPMWQGFVDCLTYRAHRMAASDSAADPLDTAVVDGLARFGWVLRQVDLHYALSPDRT